VPPPEGDEGGVLSLGQFPVDEELLHACFASSSEYGYLSSFELAHLQRRVVPLPTHRYDWLDVHWLEQFDEVDLDVLPLFPLSPLLLQPPTKSAAAAAAGASRKNALPTTDLNMIFVPPKSSGSAGVAAKTGGARICRNENACLGRRDSVSLSETNASERRSGAGWPTA